MSTRQKITTFQVPEENRALRIWDVVEDHKPRSEVIALKFGSFLLGAPTVVTSLLCQKYFNRRYKIGGKNLFTYIPMLVPAIGTGLIHRRIVETDVLLEKMQCRGCFEFKSASMHLVAGVFWSFLMSSFAGTMVASLKKTVYVPPIDKNPLQTLQLVGKHFYRFMPTAIAMCLGNFAYALVLTHLEVEQYKNMKNRMLTRLNSLELEVTSTDFDDNTL